MEKLLFDSLLILRVPRARVLGCCPKSERVVCVEVEEGEWKAREREGEGERERERPRRRGLSFFPRQNGEERRRRERRRHPAFPPPPRRSAPAAAPQAAHAEGRARRGAAAHPGPRRAHLQRAHLVPAAARAGVEARHGMPADVAHALRARDDAPRPGGAVGTLLPGGGQSGYMDHTGCWSSVECVCEHTPCSGWHSPGVFVSCWC
jgi:hypothetical protein